MKLEGEEVCEKCGCALTSVYGDLNVERGRDHLGSTIGKARAGRLNSIFSTSESYMRKYSNIFLKSREEKDEYRLNLLAERVEVLLGLPSYLREDAIKILMSKASVRSIGALAYAYIIAARMRGNWAISWHIIHKKLRELGIRAEIEELANLRGTSTHLNYVSRIINKVAFAFKERLVPLGVDPHTYYMRLHSLVRRIACSVDNTQLGGRSPFSLAVTLVYFAERELAREERRKPLFTQAEIAALTGVSIYTIREAVTLLRRLIFNNAASAKSIIEAKV